MDKKLKFYVIDGYSVARQAGMGSRINTIMQTCFFAISGVLPRDEAIAAIKRAIQKTYGKRGDAVVQKNFAAVDASLAHLHEVKVPGRGDQPFRYSAACAGNRSRVRSRRSRRDDFRQRRFASRKRLAAGRDVSHRHFAMGKAKYRAADSGMGRATCAFSAGNACWSARTR